MREKQLRTTGLYFIAASVAWFVAAELGQHTGFIVVGIAFLGIGGAFILLSRRSRSIARHVGTLKMNARPKNEDEDE